MIMIDNTDPSSVPDLGDILDLLTPIYVEYAIERYGTETAKVVGEYESLRQSKPANEQAVVNWLATYIPTHLLARAAVQAGGES